jgi:EmrB/QacA subfamily drug resistance transporter
MEETAFRLDAVYRVFQQSGRREEMRRQHQFRHPWRIFSLVAVGVFMSTLDSSIVNIALPAIMKDLEGSFAGVEWVVMIYLLTVSALLLSFGRLSDIIGRRRVYCTGFLLFAGGSFLCGLAPTTLWLIAFRAVQGCGAAMLMACSPAVIVDVFPEAERGRALGAIGAVVAVGLTTGPALGGVLIHYISWRAIFYLNVPIGIFAAVLVLRMFRGEALNFMRPQPFDGRGAFLLAGALSAFLVAASHGCRWGALSVPTLFFAALAAVGGVLFVRCERRAERPLVDFDVFRIRLFALPILGALFLFVSLFAIVFLMPFYLVDYAGFTENHAGYIMVTPFVFLFFMAPAAGSLYDRIGSRLLCTAGMGILFLSELLLMTLPEGGAAAPVVWRLALAGIGTALFTSPNTSAAMNAVPPEQRGVASGMVATARNLGMVLGIAMAGAIFHGMFHAASGGADFSGYRPEFAPAFKAAFTGAMAAGAAAAALGTAAAFLRGRDHPGGA